MPQMLTKTPRNNRNDQNESFYTFQKFVSGGGSPPRNFHSGDQFILGILEFFLAQPGSDNSPMYARTALVNSIYLYYNNTYNFIQDYCLVINLSALCFNVRVNIFKLF